MLLRCVTALPCAALLLTVAALLAARLVATAFLVRHYLRVGITPPQVSVMLANLDARTKDLQAYRVKTLTGGQVKVYPNLRQGNMNYICDVANKTCTCGMLSVTGELGRMCIVKVRLTPKLQTRFCV